MSEIIDIVEQLLYENAEVRADDSSNLGQTATANLATLLSNVVAAQGKPVIIEGLAVLPDEEPSTSVRISTGFGFTSAQALLVLSKSSLTPNNFLHVSIPLNGQKAVFNLAIKPIWQEYHLATRRFKNVSADEITTQQVPTQRRLFIEALVSEGGANSSIDAGYIKIAELHVEADTEVISADNIKNISAEDFNSVNSNWLADQSSIYHLGTIDSLKARLNKLVDADGQLKSRVIIADALNFGPDDNQLSAKQIPVGQAIAYAETNEEISSQASVATALDDLASKVATLMTKSSGTGGSFTLAESIALNLAETSKLNNALYSARNRALYLPLKTAGLAAKFELEQWQSFNDQAQSDYKLYFEPAEIEGSVEIDVELGNSYLRGQVLIDLDYAEKTVGSGSLELYLAASADGLTYSAFSKGSSLDIASSTQFLRIKLMATAKDDNLFTLKGLSLLVFTIKNSEKNELFIDNRKANDEGFTLVEFKNSFNEPYLLHINSYSSPATFVMPIYYKNNDKGFWIKLVNLNQELVEGTIAYTVEEY